ncbi:secreted RxLR effector protein 161-like [Lactuca sativa]|uniref:secreted RxLR effector protein 161-like n=1 Tax=Lactuca sativa TaxID=4236 RepID=UPI000CD7E89C|nr:secreted RxLR effector protein 161-like [Lactuca sativa]
MDTCASAKVPMGFGHKIFVDPSGAPVDEKKYCGMIRSLLYLTARRPDIMFSACLCARFQANPKMSHLLAVKQIFRYLKGTKSLGLWYPANESFLLQAYADSNYGCLQLDRKSTSGGCQLLGGRLVSWSSKKQNCIALSTAEAKYIAAANCTS